MEFFDSAKIFVLYSSFSRIRRKLYEDLLKKYKIHVCEVVSNCSHIIVDDTMDWQKLTKHVSQDIQNLILENKIVILKANYISRLLQNKHVALEEYVVANESLNVEPVDDKSLVNRKREPSTSELSSSKKLRISMNQNDSDEFSNDEHDEDLVSRLYVDDSSKWICGRSSKDKSANVNTHITTKLKEMCVMYETLNDRWRVLGYKKAIAAISTQEKEIASVRDALAIPGIGKKIADKIGEILATGSFSKLSNFEEDEKMKVILKFTKVWGAGAKTADNWYRMGFRDLNDVAQYSGLTRQQVIGLELYDDLIQRMPREEAGEIEAFVSNQALQLSSPGVLCTVCGSYRRGRSTCGDVDMLISHQDGVSHQILFKKLIQKLQNDNFLTHHLTTNFEADVQTKYMGVCKLPNSSLHRRIDILCIPHKELGCALVYFTGSAHFNRSLRLLARRNGMTLNEHRLSKGVVRKNGVRLSDGAEVDTSDGEEAVFKALGVPYRPPTERDW